MRIGCLVITGLFAAGCAGNYFVTQHSVEALKAASVHPEIIAVPVVENGQLEYVRASRLALLPADAAPSGFVHARTLWHPRNRSWLIGGAVVLGAGVVLVAAGAGDLATPRHCGGFDLLCGLDEAIGAVTIMGCGGVVSLVGILLTATGGRNTSPNVSTGEPGVVYLPR